MDKKTFQRTLIVAIYTRLVADGVTGDYWWLDILVLFFISWMAVLCWHQCEDTESNERSID